MLVASFVLPQRLCGGPLSVLVWFAYSLSWAEWCSLPDSVGGANAWCICWRLSSDAFVLVLLTVPVCSLLGGLLHLCVSYCAVAFSRSLLQLSSVVTVVARVRVKVTIILLILLVSLCIRVPPLLSWRILRMGSHLGTWVFAVPSFCLLGFSGVIPGRVGLPCFFERSSCCCCEVGYRLTSCSPCSRLIVT